MDSLEQIKSLISQLYPTGRAWNHITDSETLQLIETFTDGLGAVFTDGIGEPFTTSTGSENSFGKKVFMAESLVYQRFYDNAISILDALIADNDNFNETDAENWERVLGLLTGSLSLEDRKAAIRRKQNYPNGVYERAYYLFIQQQLRDAGFDVYIQENRFYDGMSGWDVNDPDSFSPMDYQFGISEMGVAELGGEIAGLDYSICANYLDETKDNEYFNTTFSLSEFGVGEMGEFQFENLPTIDRDQQLRFTFFVGGPSFPSVASVPVERKNEFRQMILKLKHIHTIAFLYVSYN